MIVLLVEDDAVLASQTIDFLQNEGIEIDYARSIGQAIGISQEQKYDAIILDINLPDGSGLELAKHWQGQQSAPILFLTARHELQDKLEAFQLGALDYITKPFALEELTARLKILVNKQPNLNNHFKLDTLEVNFDSRVAKRGERVILLSPQQWQLLALLSKHSPNPIDKTDIMTQIWPEQDVNNNMYKSLITRLRSNLSQSNECQLLHTLKKQGLVLKIDEPNASDTSN